MPVHTGALAQICGHSVLYKPERVARLLWELGCRKEVERLLEDQAPKSDKLTAEIAVEWLKWVPPKLAPLEWFRLADTLDRRSYVGLLRQGISLEHFRELADLIRLPGEGNATYLIQPWTDGRVQIFPQSKEELKPEVSCRSIWIKVAQKAEVMLEYRAQMQTLNIWYRGEGTLVLEAPGFKVQTRPLGALARVYQTTMSRDTFLNQGVFFDSGVSDGRRSQH